MSICRFQFPHYPIYLLECNISPDFTSIFPLVTFSLDFRRSVISRIHMYLPTFDTICATLHVTHVPFRFHTNIFGGTEVSGYSSIYSITVPFWNTKAWAHGCAKIWYPCSFGIGIPLDFWLHETPETEPPHEILYTCTLPNAVPMKNLSCIENILDISTKWGLLCSPWSPASNWPHFSSLAPPLAELAHLCVLFILLLVCRPAKE